MPHRNVPPYFFVNPCFSIKSIAPSLLRIPIVVAGSSDSPIRCRGNRSFSKRTTFQPKRARKPAAHEPPGPPPITTASYSLCAVLIFRRPSLVEAYCMYGPPCEASETLRDFLNSTSKYPGRL